jgi:hypothetical protein
MGRRDAIIYCEGLRKIADAAAFPAPPQEAGRWELSLALKFTSGGSDAGQVAKRDNLLAFCSCTLGKVGKQTFINFVNYSSEKNRVCLVASCNTPTMKTVA